MKSRTEVVAMVRSRVRLKHYALATEDAYCGWVGRYYDFCKSLRDQMSHEDKAGAFLTHLAVAGHVSAKTQNQALSALVFLYKDVLNNPLGEISALRAKRPGHERTAPSRDQIIAFRSAVVDRDHTPARLLVDLLYGCGLRVSEPLELRVKDILWDKRQLIIRAAKGGKDRRIPIPSACLNPLRTQVAKARTIWEQDRAKAPTVGVSLPFQLRKKYPSAAFAWQWFWVFPAPGHCIDPRSGEHVHYHLLYDSLQRAVHEASLRAGLESLISPHILRHAYATHSREAIEALRQLMGHSSIETTAGYRHPAIEAASNPLDDILNVTPQSPSK
jgi:integron integrase